MELKSERIRSIIDSFKPRFGHKRYHFSPAIPAVKLAKAIRVFASGVAAGEVLFFFDNSIFGDGRSGILLTDATLYSTDGLTKVKIDYFGLKPAAIRKFYGDNRLFVGEQSLNGPGLFGRKEFPVLSEMLNEISRSVSPSGSTEAQATASMADPSRLRDAGCEGALPTPSPAVARNLATAGEVITGRVAAFFLLALLGVVLYFLSSFLFLAIMKNENSRSGAVPIVLSLILLSGLPKLSSQITQAMVNVRLKSESLNAKEPKDESGGMS